MNSQRVEQLKNLIQDDPHDPFYVYALALEFIHTHRPEALHLFSTLLNDFPDYLPTYYQAGLLKVEMGDEEDGKKILEKGIVLARQKGEHKIMNELRSLLDSI